MLADARVAEGARERAHSTLCSRHELQGQPALSTDAGAHTSMGKEANRPRPYRRGSLQVVPALRTLPWNGPL